MFNGKGIYTDFYGDTFEGIWKNCKEHSAMKVTYKHNNHV